MRKLFIIALVAAIVGVGLGIRAARSQPAFCQLSGNLSHVYAVPFPIRVYFKATTTQNAQASIVPGGDSCSEMTDANGNLPTSGPDCNGSNFIQGAIVQVTISVAGQDRPIQIQIPYNTTADIATLILANRDPPSIVTGIICNGCVSVVNPGLGQVGQATLNVTGGPPGFSPLCATLVGSTPTMTPVNSTSPVKECFTQVLGANTTLTSFPAASPPVIGWVAHIIITQPSGGHSYTFAFSAGAGVNIVYPNAGGCASLPTMPTGTGHSLLLDVIYNPLPGTPELDVLSCPTTGS
jgi:hypothetical protein